MVGQIAHIVAGNEWVDQTGIITASSPGSITVSYIQETSYQVPKAGNRFYIVGSFQTLNTAAEWYRDPNTGLLYLWDPASDSPGNHTIEAKARLYGFDLSGMSYIYVQNINLFACTINTDANSSHLLLDHLNATYVSHAIGLIPDTQDPWGAQFHPHTTGIILNGQFDVLQNSTIAFSSGDGVFVGGSNNTVFNCLIHDTDYEGGDEAGITTLGSSEYILDNTIYNTGRSGIVIRNTTASQIEHNNVYSVGLQMTDLGAIYTWGTDGQGTEIAYNIDNVHTGGYGGAGIYLDNGSANYIVDHNLVYNCDFALKMNPPSTNNLIVNNTFEGTSYGLESSGNESMTGCVIANNIFHMPVMFGPGLTQSHNILTAVNPLFVNTSLNDYQLQSTSPAISAGVVMSPYTNGYLGSAPEIGAYEYGLPAFLSGSSTVATTGVSPGGVASGGASTGGVASGGVASGGVASGGASTGGVASGGASTGGVVTAGTETPNLATQVFSPQTHGTGWGTVSTSSGVRFAKLWSWIGFNSVNFGTGVTQLVARVSSLPSVIQHIQVRIDSPIGPTVGTLIVPATRQSSSTITTLTAKLKDITGIHNLYLVLSDKSAGVVLDSFTFTPLIISVLDQKK